MKIIATLIWYDESVSWLSAWVTGTAKLADHIVCVDGAYDLFPGAQSRPTSGPDQQEALLRAADAAGVAISVHVPSAPWRGEVEKRSFALSAAMLVADPWADWIITIDGDEYVSNVPLDLRERLEATDRNVAGISLWQRNVNHPLPTNSQAVAFLDGSPMTERQGDHRVLYRAIPGLHCDRAHYIVKAEVEGETSYLRGRPDLHDLAPLLDCGDLMIEHRHNFRLQDRNRQALVYCANRDACGIESVVEMEMAQ